MTGRAAPPPWLGVLLGLSAAMLVALALVSPGPFNLDEVIYLLGVDAAARTGGVVVENGRDAIAHDALRIWFLQPGTGGLVSQYPVGSAYAGALLTPLFGARALIALNVAAGIGTLFATHALAMRLFGARPVATLAVVLLAGFTFWPEYLFGHWPHAVSVLCTTLALVLVLKALALERGAARPAALAGLVVGAGMLFRLDGFLLLPPVAVMTILWAVRPVQVLAGGAAGLVPMVAALAATNHAKFGAWNPLSYGASSGGTDIWGHAGAAGILAVALAGLVALRFLPPVGARGLRATAVAAVLGVLALLVTPLAPWVWRMAHGVAAIILDATTITDPRPGVRAGPGGTLLFWGLPKKALVQSLPWLGLLGFLFGGAGSGAGNGAGGSPDMPKRALPTVGLVAAVWALPFVALSWHGGLGSNMRYLLPILPPLAALAAWVIVRLATTVRTGPRLLMLGALVPLAAVVLVRIRAPEAANQVHQVYSTYLFYAIFVLSLGAGLAPRATSLRRGLSAAALVAAGAGLGLSLVLTASDIAASQSRRASNAASAEATASIAGPVVFYGPPETYSSAIGDPERVMALSFPPGGNAAFDPALVAEACTAGYRVVMWAVLAGTTGLPEARFAPLETGAGGATDDLVEVICE